MKASYRIVLNTLATYTRSVIAAGLALFSSRWVLESLGHTDYGLFSIVGSIIIFITFLNSVLSTSAARHYAYSIGKDDPQEVNRWFNAALSMHILLAFILVSLGWIIGEYVISNVLTVPEGRLSASISVFRVSLLSAFVSMISIPFMAMFRAKQYIAMLSFIEMLQSISVFTFAYFLSSVKSDRLIFYAVGMVVIIVAARLVEVIGALVVFKECRMNFKLWFDKYRLKEIFSFASWSFIGSFGGILRNQGSAILLNLHFGPLANSAYAIANQVSSHSSKLSIAMIGAFSPEITTSEGRGDRARMLNLANRASKFGAILIMLFAIPLCVEMDYILKLWLKQPPVNTAVFCQLILLTFVVDKLTVGNMIAVNAYGKIAFYQTTVGTILVLTIPVSWIFFKLGAPEISIGFAFLITMSMVSIGRVLWTRYLFGIKVKEWINNVFLPVFVVGMLSLISAILLQNFMKTSLVRLLSISLVSVFVLLVSSWLYALNADERAFLTTIYKRFSGKMFKLAL